MNTEERESHMLLLRKAQEEGRFAEFQRKPKTLESVTGYLLEDSLDCLLIEELNWDCFKWNGKCILWKHTLKRIRPFEQTEWPIIAARKLRILRKTYFEKKRDTLETFLQRHLPKGDVILLEQEQAKPEQLFLCEILGIRKEGLHVKSYDRTLLKVDEMMITFQYLTKLTIADAYSCAARTALKSTMLAKTSIG